MHRSQKNKTEQGFSLLELIVTITVMVVVTAGIFALMSDSVKSSTTTLEMTDGQQSLRIAHEYITRDLMNAGDGLNSLNAIRVPQNFVTNYLSVNPVTDPATPGVINLGIVTSDNNVPANTAVPGSGAPLLNVRSTPVLTDRLTILQMDQTFTPITLAAAAIDTTNGLIAVSPAVINQFSVGEVYFLTSSVGGIFVTITNRLNVGGPNPSLVLAAGDTFGFNSTGAGSLLNSITSGASLPSALCRMKMIHYYVNSNGLLMRRVFGVQGTGFTESVIAEHLVSLQFRYFLNMRDAGGNVVQPVAQLSNSQELIGTRQVEVAMTVETPHSLLTGQRPQISMTTSTSVRNMQFRQSLQPGAGG